MKNCPSIVNESLEKLQAQRQLHEEEVLAIIGYIRILEENNHSLSVQLEDSQTSLRYYQSLSPKRLAN